MNAVSGILSAYNIYTFFSYGQNGGRNIDAKKFDPYYKDKPEGTTNQPSYPVYKPDYSFSQKRGIFAFKDNPDKYITFQFNPEQHTDDKSVVYEDRQKTGLDEVDFLWVSGGPRNWDFELFLDATEGSKQTHLGIDPANAAFTHDPNRGVLNQVEFIQSFMRPANADPNTPVFVNGNVKLSNQFTAPPEVIFVFGPFYFEGVITRATPSYQLWNRQLVPLRATMAITIRIQEGRTLTFNQRLNDLALNIQTQ